MSRAAAAKPRTEPVTDTPHAPRRTAGPRAFRLPVLTAAAALLPALAAPAAAQSLTSVPIDSFENPVYVAVAPGAPKLLFVVERAGRIRVLLNENKLARPFLDIRGIVLGAPDPGAGSEQGLLSVAFAPDYRTSRRFYVAFTNRRGDIEIDEFRRMKDTATRANPASRRKVLVIPHRGAQNHNGGQLQFGPDKLLYISTGDGGGIAALPTGENARRLNRLLGKILRIDPRRSKDAAYRIPKSNPFVGKPGRDEIFSYGLRNPWRFSFDGNRLLIADVGHGAWEEVNLLSRKAAMGANFGWPQYEGNAVFDNSRPGAHPPTFPVHVYGHGPGCSVTGGYVARGAALPGFAGRYIYGDFCSGQVRSFIARSGAPDDEASGLTLNSLSSFGAGFGGRIYAAQLGGTVSRLEEEPAP